jgi:hypothetical protein
MTAREKRNGPTCSRMMYRAKINIFIFLNLLNIARFEWYLNKFRENLPEVLTRNLHKDLKKKADI